MHMADALVSPVVGGAGWAAALAVAGYGARKLRAAPDDAGVPMMGVGAAFVFAAQMINFTIPGTGSSGHLGGGLLLAALLGPHAAFLAMASILTVQALFFADGGLLALGCNAVNLGLFPCLIAYPLLYRPIAGSSPTRARLTAASVVAAIVGLQLGALGVVLETRLSGVAALPTGAFLLLMQPIHLAIGAVEGLATAAVLLFVWRARPDALYSAPGRKTVSGKLVAALLAAALAVGGALSWFASSKPDGLEWALSEASGAAAPIATAARWPAVDGGTSLAGVVGAALTLLVAGLIGFAVRRRFADKA
jgi:cobalt/nickel transport system permease protein